jgi:TolB-like protein
MNIFSELRRREVWKTLVFYIVGAWVVIQGADLFFPGWCIAESAIRHVWIAALLGLPIALVVSWQFDISAEGLRRTISSGNDSRALVRSDYVLLSILSTIMVAIILMQAQLVLATRDCGLADRFKDFDPPENSIAVLPFISLSTNEEDAWLGAAFADTVLDSLANLPGALVTSRKSSFDPRLKGKSAREVALMLGVAFVLEGSVQRQGDRLRITPQIVDVRQDSHFWSRKIDRTYIDLFEIQDEVAEAAASAVQVVFSNDVRLRIDREGTDNLEAFEEYSKAIDNLRVRTFDSVSEAAAQLQRAIELDPDYARAHAMLGHVYIDGRFGAWSELAEEERKERARDEARTALRIAPGMSKALAVLGDLTDDVDAKGELYRQAIANSPGDVLAIQAYTRHLFLREYQTGEAMKFAEKLIRLDPLDEKHYWQLAWQLKTQSRVPEALEVIARGKEKIPDSVELRDLETFCYWDIGERSSAILAKYETLAIDPKEFINRWVIAGDYLSVGMPDEADRWFQRAAETAPEQERDNLQLIRQTSLDVYYQRNDEEVFESLQRWVKEAGHWRFPGWVFSGAILVEYGEKLGRLEEVLNTAKSQAPHLFAEQPDIEKDLYSTFRTGLILLRVGDRQRGERFVRRILEELDRRASSDWGEDASYVHALLALGDTNTALEMFRVLEPPARFGLGGLGWRFIMQNSPDWAPIREEPEYAALLEELDRNAEEQRQRLQAMELPVM